MTRPAGARSLAVAVAVALLVIGARVAEACPACAGGRGGSPPWVVVLLIAAPIAAFATAAWIVWRLIARRP